MSEKLLKTWLKEGTNNHDAYSKVGFTIFVPHSEDNEIKVFHWGNKIEKPFYNLDQAMYWCEGRMFERDKQE